MSSNSTPGHSSSGYDSLYDPSFSAEMSSKMHVPDKICIIDKSERPEYYNSTPEEMKTNMNVPERILVAGDNKHIAMRESLPEMKYDTPFPHELHNVILSPPPDILTIDEYPYPTIDQKSHKNEVKKAAQLDQSINGMNDSMMNTSYGPDEEVGILRRQVRHLARRVLAIEQENQQRQQREIIIYTLSIAYFFLKGLRWLHRQL